MTDELERYALEHTSAPPPGLAELERQARETLGSPWMLSGLTVGRLLEMLVFALRARLVVEIGTYAGYSASAMAAGLPPDGRIVSCEISERNADFARRHIAAGGLADRVEVRVGPALETLAEIDGPIDFVFIDADKGGYPDYYEAVLPKLADGGLIVADNTLMSGRVLDDSAGQDGSTRAVARFNELVLADERVICVVLPLRDGLTLIRKR